MRLMSLIRAGWLAVALVGGAAFYGCGSDSKSPDAAGGSGGSAGTDGGGGSGGTDAPLGGAGGGKTDGGKTDSASTDGTVGN